MSKFIFTSSRVSPHFLHARFDIAAPGARALVKDIKQIPGVTFHVSEWDVKSWLVPIELRPAVTTLAHRHGFEVTTQAEIPGLPPHVTLFNALGKFEPFQKPDIETTLARLHHTGAALVAYAMGLGKTPVAIELARQLQNQLRWAGYEIGGGNPPVPQFDILIVCPAMAREVWPHGNGPQYKDNGFARWWPDRYKREIHRGREYVIEPYAIRHGKGDGPGYLSRWVSLAGENRGSEAETLGTGGHGVVVSYGVLRNLLDALGDPSNPGSDAVPPAFNPQIIILDEAHYISNPRSQWSKAAFTARERWPNAKRLALTGTPLMNPSDLASLHTVLDWLWPDRFGTPGSFKFHYMNPEAVFDSKENFRGYKYKGLNEANKEELRVRLLGCAVRLTKRDVAHLLPPFNPNLLPFDGDRFGNGCEKAVSLLREGHDHVRVACYLRQSAKDLAKALTKLVDFPVHVIDGSQTPEQRAHTLATARSQEKSVTVATISSTSVAIDLTFQTASVYVELSNNITEVLQNLGRGHRASSQRGHDVFILADESGDDMANMLYRKATVLSDLLSAGTEEAALTETLSQLKEKGLSESEISDMLALISYEEAEN